MLKWKIRESIVVLWVATPCNLLGGQQSSSKKLVTIHGLATRKTIIITFTDIWILNSQKFGYFWESML
jgi:hypothetical protein